MRNMLVGLVLVMVVSWTIGCSEMEPAFVDRAEARAQATQPASTEVEMISIATNPNLPTMVLTVEPFGMGASGVTADTSQSGAIVVAHGRFGQTQVVNMGGGGGVINPGEQIGPGVSAQLISSLQKVGNVAIIDYATYNADKEKIAANLRPEEFGPFVVKGTVTEFSEVADGSGKGESRGPGMGAFLPYVGPIIALADSGKSSSETTKKGVVGFDVQIVDPKSGRMITSFTASGSFVSVINTKSQTSWGKTKTTTEYASSAIGQAQRIALNKAVTQIHRLVSEQATLAKR